jgi:Xaa-Pro aminopeptidase
MREAAPVLKCRNASKSMPGAYDLPHCGHRATRRRMFQNYDDSSESHLSATRVALLRAELARRGLDGFIVPRQDEFQGEYVPPHAERLRWLTGFAGSWGLAILMRDSGAIFVDGRYTVQVGQQTDGELFKPHHLVDDPPEKWIARELKPGLKLGYDPWILTADQAERYARACEKAGAALVACEDSPLDAVWADRPPRPAHPISVQPTQFAGRTPADKHAAIAKDLGDADAVVLTQPDSVAWLFNIRGRDVTHTPVVNAFAIVHRQGPADIFIDAAKVPEDAESQLRGIARIRPPAELEPALAELGGEKRRVAIDPNAAPERIRAILAAAGAEILKAKDPCILPKARKNGIEQEGARAAHRRDGVAMSRFLCWLDVEAPKGKLDEIAVAEKLIEFRKATGLLEDISFDTISAAGPHAAIPHYRVSKSSNLPLKPGGLFLIDSGAQYRDGTTDITRTVIVGAPTEEMRDRFTRVLKGMIGVSRIRFPKGTCGSQLDVLARAALWSAGLDYDHGTGHGVGSFLSVHEGPARINKSDRTPLEPGMILSNEPGYYKPGHFGIRTENLLLVREAEPVTGGERPMHWFETLTLCPIDRRLIVPSMLTDEERAWLDAYHGRVLREIGPLLPVAELSWLESVCAAIRPT